MMEIFDSEEVALNKQGKKSERQIEEIKQMANPGLWFYVGLGVLVAGGCFSTVLEGSGMAFLGAVLGIAGFLAAAMGFKNWNKRRKLIGEAIQSASGKVTFRDGQYNAETNLGAEISHLGLGGGVELPPGRYNFYYLASNGWLLGADPLNSEMEMKSEVNKILARAFRFTPEHLEKCRQEAEAGIIQTAQGIPETQFMMESAPKEDLEDSDATITRTYCKIGNFKFETFDNAVLKKFSHRVYHREEKLEAIEIL